MSIPNNEDWFKHTMTKLEPIEVDVAAVHKKRDNLIKTTDKTFTIIKKIINDFYEIVEKGENIIRFEKFKE